MNWNIDKAHPICPQICEFICVEIANGTLKPRTKIYSVRELALILCVNPNTVQKSFELLEEKGIIYSIRGSGWYINDNITPAKLVVDELRAKKTNEYLQDMKNLGFDIDETLDFLRERGERKQ